MKYNELVNTIENTKTRSAWSKGVKEYAEEILETLSYEFSEDDEVIVSPYFKKLLLNGATDWNEYSWGGCSLIYDTDIAARLCNKTELRITDNGHKDPNKNEQWLDTQARALYQAEQLILNALR